MTKEQHKRMRELRNKESLTRSEHKELDKLEKEWDEILDSEDEPSDEPKDEPEDEPEDEPKDEPEDKPEDEPEDEPKDEPEDEPSEPKAEKPKKPLIKPQQDHWYFRDRGPFGRKKKPKVKD